MHKYSSTVPQRIFVNIRCQGIANSPAQGRGYLIVYGIEGKQNDVSWDVYDNPYTFENGRVTFKAAVDFFKSTNSDATVNLLKSTNFNENINMKNHQIKNVQDGVENNDVANIKQLNEFESGLVRFFRTEMQNKINISEAKLTNLINSNKSYYENYLNIISIY